MDKGSFHSGINGYHTIEGKILKILCEKVAMSQHFVDIRLSQTLKLKVAKGRYILGA